MIPLFKTNQIRQADKYAINKLGIPGIVLMENASLSIVNSIFSEFPDLDQSRSIGIICGKGNNGGDGFATARHLINYGFNVTVVSLGKKTDFKGDAKTNFDVFNNLLKSHKQSKIVFYKTIRDLSPLSACSIIIDAMLGTGTQGKLREPFYSIVKRANKFNGIKVSIDIPTGLDADNGTGSECFKADLTVTLAEFKRGLFFGKGYSHSGSISKGSIGIGDDYFDQLHVDDYLMEPEDALSGLPQKQIDVHKYSAGKVLTIAGSTGLPGAAFFTANSVLRSGAGASILAFPDSLKQLAQQKLQASTVTSYEDESTGYLQRVNIAELTDRIKWADVIAIGPGLGRNVETEKAVNYILDKFSAKKFVIDADGVSALSNKRYLKVNLKNKVLTPHHKEFAEMLGISILDLESDLISTGSKFTEKTGAYLVLKGAPTIIFNPEGERFVNSTGNSGMAKFGVGDVLTGIIASFIAQSGGQIEKSVISAVYIHSLSADILQSELTEFSIGADDIAKNLPNTIKFLRKSIV